MKKTKDAGAGGAGMTRRNFLKKTAAVGAMAATMPLFNINHAWSKDVYYDGEVFDGQGTVLNFACWGGFWQELERKYLLDKFEKDFNCKVRYESSFPWFAKMIASGPKNPVFDMVNYNMPEMYKTAAAGDYFMPLDEIKENVPNCKDLWPFAFQNGIGVTWSFGQYCYVYREDLVKNPPKSFGDFWNAEFDNKRGMYITSNTLFMTHYMLSNLHFGGNEHDMKAGLKAMRDAMPAKIYDFTGNLQQAIERGEIIIGIQYEPEAWLQREKGIPVNAFVWEERKPILTQTRTISNYLPPMRKKLTLALMDRVLSPENMNAFSQEFALRPTNKKAELSPVLQRQGVKNDEASMTGFWIPDWNWYLENEDDIVEECNEIFSS